MVFEALAFTIMIFDAIMLNVIKLFISNMHYKVFNTCLCEDKKL